MYKMQNPDMMLEFFTTELYELIVKCAPLKKVFVRNNKTNRNVLDK